MTEKEFHAARWMWAVIQGKVMIAMHGDQRSHYEWVSHLMGLNGDGRPEPFEPFFNELTRGYVLDGRLVAYKGQDFSRWVSWEDTELALNELEKVAGPIHTVAFGARYSKDEMPWPVVASGDAEQFRKHLAEKREKKT